MSIVVIKGVIPSNGNPNGIVDATKGAVFYKSGSLYKLNPTGLGSGSWTSVSFNPFNKSRAFLSQSDIDSVPTASNGEFLYVKDTESGSFGWKYLSDKGIFIDNG